MPSVTEAGLQREIERMRLAQLRDMPMEVLATFLRSQGHGDVADVLLRRAGGETVPLIKFGGVRPRPSFTIEDDDERPRAYLSRCSCFFCKARRSSSLLAPLADGDDLPFDAERDL